MKSEVQESMLGEEELMESQEPQWSQLSSRSPELQICRRQESSE